MNVKALQFLAVPLVLASPGHFAIAEPLGEHPAAIVARTWSTRGIDPNTFIVLPPAGLQSQAVSPIEKDKAVPEQAQRAASAR